MYIDHLTEYNILQTLLQKLPKVNPLDTVILNVSPDYSSTVAMQIAHYLSDKGHMLDIISVDVPYPGENKDLYVEFSSNLTGLTLATCCYKGNDNEKLIMSPP